MRKNHKLPSWALWQSLLAVLLVLSGIQAAHAQRGVEQVTSVEGITEYRLKNGLEVLLFPDPTKETVTINVTYKVGSRHENYGETGMAHLLEHLLFKGSKNHKDIPAELSRHGAKPNGTTWIDRTNYFETFNATDENIDWALSLEADRMVNSFINKKDLDSEMTVVRNEFERAENNPFRVLMQKMMSTSYMWHNNGKPTIGARSDIENVSIERLRAFYKNYYQPDNAVLTVAGQFDTADMLKRINNTFGKIKKPTRVLEEHYTREPPKDGEKSVVVRRVGDIQWYATAYHIPAGSHPDYPALEVLSQILGDTPRGRLHQNLVENKLSVGTFAFPFQLSEPGLMFLGAQVEKEGDLDKTRKAFLDTVESIKSKPITSEEVERARRNLLKEFDLAFNSSETIAILLSEYIGMGDWRLLFLTRDLIEKVQTEDVQRVAETYLVTNNRTEGRFIPTENPERVTIPEAPPVSELLAGYKGGSGHAQGEAFDPDFDNIEKRTEQFALDSGAEVALLPKKSRGESVSVRLNMQFGTLDTLKGAGAQGEVVADMLTRGTTRYTREQLEDRLDELKVSLGVDGQTNGLQATLETTRENLIPALELLGHILREPSFNKKEFEQLRDQVIAGLEASRQEPQAIVFRMMSRFYAQFPADHPRYVPTIDEQIAELRALTLDQLKAFHKRFYAANFMQIAVVGDFQAEPVKTALAQAFGEWVGKEPYVRVPHDYKSLTPVNETINTPDKENAAMVAMLPLKLGSDNRQAAPLNIGAYIYGGGFLNSRLATRLRQKDGLSYSVGAWASISPFEERTEFSSYAIFAPQNMAAVEQGIREELARAVTSGFDESELRAAKSGMLQKSRVDRADDETLASLLTSNLLLNREMQWHKQYEQQVRDADLKQVNKVFGKLIDVEQLSIFKAADLSRAKAPALKPPMAAPALSPSK